MRIVSLLPSATEIVYALGLGDELVGVTFECDMPAEARRDKAVVVGGRDTSGMTPGAIDDYVRSQMAAGADLYTLHAEALAGLDPELILTQDLCRVCALPSDHVEDALDYLGCQAEVVSLDPHSLDDVLDTIVEVGRRTGVEPFAQTLVGQLRSRLARVAAAVAARPRPRVTVVEWVDPPFTAGHWVPDLVRAAGGEPVAANPGEKSVATTWSAVARARPDVVVVSPCGVPPGRRGRPGPAGARPPPSQRGGLGDRRRRDRGAARPPIGRRGGGAGRGAASWRRTESVGGGPAGPSRRGAWTGEPFSLLDHYPDNVVFHGVRR